MNSDLIQQNNKVDIKYQIKQLTKNSTKGKNSHAVYNYTKPKEIKRKNLRSQH